MPQGADKGRGDRARGQEIWMSRFFKVNLSAKMSGMRGGLDVGTGHLKTRKHVVYAKSDQNCYRCSDTALEEEEIWTGVGAAEVTMTFL